MHIVITNDDGIDSPGLHALARAAVASGATVTVAAPVRESSGSGAAILSSQEDGRVEMEERSLDGLEGVRAFAVHAAPALISLIAGHGAFGEVPSIVLSGVNRGANVGRAILHSGTVGAALTAGVNGGRGLAVSLDVGLRPSDIHWDLAAQLAVDLVDEIVAMPQGTVLNLNVPLGGPGQSFAIRPAELAPFGIVQTTVSREDDRFVRLALADVEGASPQDSDVGLLAAGFATLTLIDAVTGRAFTPRLRD